MENIIVLADRAKASIKPLEHDSVIVFTESQLNDFANMVAREASKVKLSNRGLTLYHSVLYAMEEAEEFGGVEGAEYIALMGAIAQECITRMNTASEHYLEGVEI